MSGHDMCAPKCTKSLLTRKLKKKIIPLSNNTYLYKNIGLPIYQFLHYYIDL